MFKPDYVAPIVGFLSSADCVDSGTVYEVFAGWAAQVRWERTGGWVVLSTRSTTSTWTCKLIVALETQLCLPQRQALDSGGCAFKVATDHQLQRWSCHPPR
jgi:multifunctional beta-oxidation protein